MELQQVCVARYDHCGVTFQGTFQDPVIVRVGTIGDRLLGIDRMRERPQIRCSRADSIFAPRELLREDALNLGLDRLRDRYLE